MAAAMAAACSAKSISMPRSVSRRRDCLRRLGALGIDLTLQALDVETPQTSEGMRQFLEIMNDPPCDEALPITDPAEEPEPDADGPP